MQHLLLSEDKFYIGSYLEVCVCSFNLKSNNLHPSLFHV